MFWIHILEERFIFGLIMLTAFLLLHDKYMCKIFNYYENKLSLNDEKYKNDIHLLSNIQSDINITMEKIKKIQKQQEEYLKVLINIINRQNGNCVIVN